ncbi:MAG: type II toxin-antitoxin system VapC family toxin [Caldilineaceae bacterium SB0665_bin_25]|nr:type II toxin-antitoxin system VapC family toxin [Caldilineaceae bacterium SB0665_bin_25]
MRLLLDTHAFLWRLAGSGRLSGPHRNPFDRMLIAQALSGNLVLISRETIFDQYGVRRLW